MCRAIKKFLLCLLLGGGILLTGCSKDDVGFRERDIWGTWRLTQVVRPDGSYYDLTTEEAEKIIEPTFAKFEKSGWYTGYGFYGYGHGTYTVSGNTITTYVAGDVYITYDVLEFHKNTVKLRMYSSSFRQIVVAQKL